MREAYEWEVESLELKIKYLKEDMKKLSEQINSIREEIDFIQWERQKANMIRWGIILANVFNSIAIIVLSVKTWQ